MVVLDQVVRNAGRADPYRQENPFAGGGVANGCPRGGVVAALSGRGQCAILGIAVYVALGSVTLLGRESI